MQRILFDTILYMLKKIAGIDLLYQKFRQFLFYCLAPYFLNTAFQKSLSAGLVHVESSTPKVSMLPRTRL